MTEKFDLMVPVKLTHTYLGDIWVAVSADTKEEAIELAKEGMEGWDDYDTADAYHATRDVDVTIEVTGIPDAD